MVCYGNAIGKGFIIFEAFNEIFHVSEIIHSDVKIIGQCIIFTALQGNISTI